MATPIKPLTECDPDVEMCALPATVIDGDGLLVVDPLTKCNRLLGHASGSIPVSDGLKVRHRTGAAADEICLPAMRSMSTSAFPRMIAQDSAGKLGHIKAPAGCKPMILVGKDGSYGFEVFESPVCYDEETICECEPAVNAGFIIREDCEGNEKLCLVQFPLTDAEVVESLFFASTSCISMLGVGTEGDPYKPTIKISAAQNNCIECRDDGLYVACGIYDAGYDPLD